MKISKLKNIIKESIKELVNEQNQLTCYTCINGTIYSTNNFSNTTGPYGSQAPNVNICGQVPISTGTSYTNFTGTFNTGATIGNDLLFFDSSNNPLFNALGCTSPNNNPTDPDCFACVDNSIDIVPLSQLQGSPGTHPHNGFPTCGVDPSGGPNGMNYYYYYVDQASMNNAYTIVSGSACGATQGPCTVYGCTDPNAINYNPTILPNCDNGSCLTNVPGTSGCGECDASAWPNYNSWVSTWSNSGPFNSTNPNQPCNHICQKMTQWNNKCMGNQNNTQTNILSCKLEEGYEEAMTNGCNC